ncbi:MAG: LPXTG cell wall anchor domain-containing protein [Butyrivibrio crossotus]|nr:LPXTG cell wall anchor domain-containing protein [Butyrivibrio crossotus]
MKKLKHNFKKGMAFVLSLAMVAGLVPAMSGGANKVQAAAGSGTEPSVTAFATKDQLMDDTFKPDANGNATTTGKLVFGKNSKGNPQEWYILGADSGVSGGKDNTIIFAANPITGEKFNSSTSNKSFASSFGVYASNPSEVYPNHYGASDLRVALQRMATNTNYFTTAEQGLMNATTVTTKDTKNSSVTYTTTDKLYALQGDFDNDQYLWAGTDDSTVLARSSYWRNGDLFWLRSPYDDNVSGALLADPGMYVSYRRVLNGCAVQPASNLDLSSVLFASAATAASSDTKSEKITDSAAMTLRLDGTGKDIGTVTYNTTTGDIKVVKGTTSQTVALVVQGNDGTNDWNYSKQITGTETINVSAIEAESNTPASINLSACKIWLEITEDNVSYAVNAEKEIEKINTTYVTKEQLMNSFKPYSNGTAVNYGKLVFGKKSDGTTAQEWYILGKDEGVSGDNTIIVAASPIARGQKFNSDISNKNDENLWSDCVYSEATITEVYANHYGASDLRGALKNMADSSNTSYFTSAEQGLMNATTVTTKDTKNSSVTYTTTDKLYALQGDYDNDQYLWAGTDDSTVLAMSSYFRNGEWFWLRSPYGRSGDFALCADRGYYVILGRVDIDSGSPVQPASNLNLSSVLFASAAKAASSGTESGTIAERTAMTLRLDGKDKNIGTVTYNTTTGDIKVTKGSTNVALIVQGKYGTNDWYYSKQITDTDTVTIKASDIAADANTPASIDLSACKIWLEATDTDGMIYAINATNVYALTVTNGSGTGEYEQGATVTITADTATSGQQFKEWEVVSGTITLADSMRETTTFTMPAEAVSVKANYEVIPVTEYTITSTTGANGSISPSGTVKVASGGSQTFTITPATGYEIDTLKVDGSAVSSVTSYTFNNVDKAHTIEATFKKKQSPEPTPEPTPTFYKIISGADSEWKQNTDGNITIRGNGEFSKFESVKVDGSIIDAKNYIVKEGSTIIILKADYLKTLSVGTHSFEIVWADGSAVTNFKISKNTDDSQQPTPPQTGDNSRPMLWVTLLAASLAGLLALLSVRRKKDDKYMQR